MMHLSQKEILADGLLLLTALIWGSAFAVVKNTLDSFPPAAIIAMRYAIATVLTGIAFRKHLRGLTRADVARGALVGLLLSAAYIVQTIGLSFTTASKNAFLTAVYVMLVPFFSMALFRQKLRRANFAAAALMLLGIGLLSLDGESGGLNIGDLLTLICGALFAGHIIAVERCQRHTDAYALLFERGKALDFNAGSVGGLLSLAIFSTTSAMSLQNIGQSMAPASHASILLSLESVLGVVFSCLLLGERVTPRMLLGFAVIFAALLVSELTPHEKAKTA